MPVPIWTDKQETARRLSQRIKSLLDVAAKALLFTCLTASRTGEALGMRWEELNFQDRMWICPAARVKTGEDHRVPLTVAMLAILEPLKSLQSEAAFKGQKCHKPLSNKVMLMLLRRMGVKGATVHGFRSRFCE